jgi:hypothetical protein
LASFSSYSDLIYAAFIDPLRSVMIIDDDYPTWEEIFDKDSWDKNSDGDLTLPVGGKKWVKNPDLPMELIRQFRGHDRGLLIDINDGKPPNAPSVDEIASHLFQSDLLVLDYQLEGEAIGGNKAIRIATSLLTQNHFNLIVIHTNKENLEEPFSEILLRLMSPCIADAETQSRLDAGEEALTDAEDEVETPPATDLKDSFYPKHYLFMRHAVLGPKAFGYIVNGIEPFTELTQILTTANIAKKHFSDILLWLFYAYQKKNEASFGDKDYPINWSHTDDCLWIRSDSGFITFAKKSDTTDLINSLKLALENWKPTPSRLLLAKYRHALDDYGVSVEDSALSNKHIFARFYKDIKAAESDPQRQTLVREHIRQQTEQIGAAIEEDVAEFGLNIVRLDADEESPFIDHYNVDLSKEQEARKATYDFNHYVSSIDVYGHHLTSGHIFELDNKKWVVVSPACDLVPGQKPMGFNEPHSGHRPFIAIELHPCSNVNNDEINSGGFVFLEDGGKVKPYCTFARSSPAIERLPKLSWQNLIALNDGVFKKEFSLELLRVVARPLSLKSEKVPVKVVSQLRSEFALNLIHRLGITMTRVGLNFVGNDFTPPVKKGD